MKAVADTLGVARSNLIWRGAKPARPRGSYRKPEDAALLPTIRQIVDAPADVRAQRDHGTVVGPAGTEGGVWGERQPVHLHDPEHPLGVHHRLAPGAQRPVHEGGDAAVAVARPLGRGALLPNARRAALVCYRSWVQRIIAQLIEAARAHAGPPDGGDHTGYGHLLLLGGRGRVGAYRGGRGLCVYSLGESVRRKHKSPDGRCGCDKYGLHSEASRIVSEDGTSTSSAQPGALPSGRTEVRGTVICLQRPSLADQVREPPQPALNPTRPKTEPHPPRCHCSRVSVVPRSLFRGLQDGSAGITNR